MEYGLYRRISFFFQFLFYYIYIYYIYTIYTVIAVTCSYMINVKSLILEYL